MYGVGDLEVSARTVVGQLGVVGCVVLEIYSCRPGWW
jgi:hypothetical protein